MAFQPCPFVSTLTPATTTIHATIGIVFSKADDVASLVLRNCVRTETIEDPVRPVAEMLKRCNLAQIMEYYKLPAIADAVTFLQALARRLGKLKKGGAPDIVGAARMVLTDFNTGKISYYTLPPKDYKPTVQLESAVVASVSLAGREGLG